MHEDVEYYQGRLLEERQRASATFCPAIAAIHRELAELYSERLRELGQAGYAAEPTTRINRRLPG